MNYYIDLYYRNFVNTKIFKIRKERKNKKFEKKRRRGSLQRDYANEKRRKRWGRKLGLVLYQDFGSVITRKRGKKEGKGVAKLGFA